MADGLFTMFTIPIGEEHEDFKTLKEEVQREIQEVERLSQVGQSSLLTSLSKLLGKKKELQDLELTVRLQRKVAGRHVWVSQLAGGVNNRWMSPSSGWMSRCPPDCQAATAPSFLWKRANDADSLKARQRVGSRPAGPFLGKRTGTFPFQSPRLRDQEIQGVQYFL